VGHDERGFPAASMTFAIVKVFPGAGDAEEGLAPLVPFQAGDQLPDGLWLVPGRLEGAVSWNVTVLRNTAG